MSEEKRHALKAQFPMPSIRWSAPIPKPAKRCCSSAASPPISPIFTRSDNVRYGQDFAPGGAQLLAYLIGRAAIPEYQVRWRWQPNSVAIWDNRCTQHYAVMDYAPCVRQMERAGIIGDRPF